MELALLKWIQSFSSPFLDGLFQLITMLGEQWAVVLALALSYWVIDKNMGEEFAFTLLISGLCNNILKVCSVLNGRSDKKAFALCGRIRPLDTLFPADTAKTQQRFIFFRLAAAADGAGLPLARSVCW